MMQSQPFLDRGAVISFLVAALVAFVVTFFVQADAWVPYVAAVAAFFVTAAVLNLRGKK